MSRKRFDFVFSIGQTCSCSRMLRECGLQYASFPLDWVGNVELEAGEGLRLASDLVAGGFSNWFKEENLERAPQCDSKKFKAYFDRGIRFFFTHDFAPDTDLHRDYPAMREKYARRIARFTKVLSSARSALAVWVTDPRGFGEVTEEDIAYCLGSLHRAWPKTEFSLLVANCVHGLRPEDMRVARGDGYECLSFDYRAVKEGPPTWDVRTEMFTPILDRYAAVDYRSRAEKRENAKREKARAYEKLKARSTLEYIVNRVQFKLYRHFKRKLERKGILQEIG